MVFAYKFDFIILTYRSINSLTKNKNPCFLDPHNAAKGPKKTFPIIFNSTIQGQKGDHIEGIMDKMYLGLWKGPSGGDGGVRVNGGFFMAGKWGRWW